MSYSHTAPQLLADLFRSRFGHAPSAVEALPPSGGNRRYFRMRDDSAHLSVIGVDGSDLQENDAFLYIDRCLSKAGFNVPAVYAVSDDGRYYLQQDLGDTSLFSILHTERGERMMERAVAALPALQCCGCMDFSHASLQKPFGERSVMWDLNYFKYCFLKPAGTSGFDEEALENDFSALCADLLTAASRCEGFMYRDCQSRNIMVCDDDVWWIDFQGGRRGPVLYDIVSMLWQAKAGLSDERRARLLDIYFDNLAKVHPYPAAHRNADVRLFALFRTLQVLGAYGFRGLMEHRAHFLTSIRPALDNLRSLIDAGACKGYPELENALRNLAAETCFSSDETEGILTVEILSFSYRKGYPLDMSGNGGGFMFDCRALHNPGRYDRYKPLTGMDAEVREFLESQGEVEPFLRSAWNLTDAAVERYIGRGFSHLQIGFGCTGGRHRSVYCAERTAAHIAETFGGKVVVLLRHREQNVTKISSF